MDVRNSAARIDLICSADARYLVRSLEEALTLRGLQVTLRDVADRAKAPIGVAVLTDGGPTVETWDARLAPYASSSRIAFEAALAPPQSDVFLLAGWPSRRADRVLADLVDHLVRAVSAQSEPVANRRPKNRDNNSVIALMLVVVLIGGVMYALSNDDATARQDTVVQDQQGLDEPGEQRGDSPIDAVAGEDVLPASASASVTPASVDRRLPGVLLVTGRSTTTAPDGAHLGVDGRSSRGDCELHNTGPAPRAHWFSWRPLVRAPDQPRIWAHVQLQYYLPEQWQCFEALSS